MSEEDDSGQAPDGGDDRAGKVPEPQGRFAGMPYDLRRPTVARARARLWNRDDHRLFTPKAFGWGYDVNFYWLAHPREYLRPGGQD
jgi:hypothetical protein